MHDVLTPAQADKAWDILVEEVGAMPDKAHWMYSQFIHYVTAPTDYGHEFRFQGSLGFGGKIHSTGKGWIVTCYPEDRTAGRDAAIDRANERLSVLNEMSNCEQGGDHVLASNEHDDAWCGKCGERLILPGYVGWSKGYFGY